MRGSLTWWNTQRLFNINVWTDHWTLAFTKSEYFLWHSYHTTPNNNGSTSMLKSWQCVLLYKGFTLFSPKDTFFSGGQKVQFWFRQQNTLLQRASCSLFSFAYYRCLILSWGHRKYFFLAFVPCRSLSFKVHCIVVLWTARPVPATLFCSYFAVAWVLQSISNQALGHSIWTFS